LEKIPIEENQQARRAFEKFFCSNRPILRKIEKVPQIIENKLGNFVKLK